MLNTVRPPGVKLTNEERMVIVTMVLQGPQTVKAKQAVADLFKIHIRTVYDVMKTFNETGRVEQLRIGGRPRKYTQSDARSVVNLALSNRFATTRVILSQYETQQQETMSRRTLCRILNCYQLSYRVAKNKPLLSDDHKRARLEWAMAHKDKTVEFWRQYLYTDECCSRCYQHRRTLVLRRQEEEWDPDLFVRNVKYGKFSVMVWGGISYNTRTALYFMPKGETMNSLAYIDVLKHFATPLLNSENLRLQQDNAPIHTSRLTKDYFQRNNIPWDPFPKLSPDLNPIEHLWNELKQKIFPEGCQTFDDFVNEVRRAWEQIQQSLIQTLIDSMPHRLQAVIDAGGDATRY